MTILWERRYGCYARREKGTCGNPRGVDATVVENRVIPLLSRSVMEELDLPELVRRAAEDSALRRERLAAAVADGRQRIARLIDAIEQGAQSQAAHRRILDIEHETAAIQLELDGLPAIPASAPEDLAERLQERLAALHRAIADAAPEEPARKSALLIARTLFKRIDVAPLPVLGEVEISIRPRADTLVALALDEKWTLTPDALETPFPTNSTLPATS